MVTLWLLPLLLALADGAGAANATYHGILDRPVTLTDGSYEGPPYVEGGAARPVVQLWKAPVAAGDMDGDHGDETVVLLAHTSGGSGERIYVAVLAHRGDGTENIGTALVGDRVKVRSLEVHGGKAVLEVVEAGPQDGMCCPTQLSRKRFTLSEGQLTLESSELHGTLSVAALGGTEWVLVELDAAALPADARPPTIVFEGSRVSGFGGCNRYMGQVTEAAPGELKFGPLAATKMGCPQPAMDLESRFTRQLGVVESYTFLAGKLALGVRDGDRRGLLLFLPRATPPSSDRSPP